MKHVALIEPGPAMVTGSKFPWNGSQILKIKVTDEFSGADKFGLMTSSNRYHPFHPLPGLRPVTTLGVRCRFTSQPFWGILGRSSSLKTT